MLLFTYYGHAAFTLNDTKNKLLFDPFFTGNPAATTTAEQIDCNYILISHGHGDHIGDAESIARRNHAAVIGVPEVVAACHAENGFGMNVGGQAAYPFGSVYLTQAIHSSGIPGAIACGFIVNMAGKNIYFAGDTAFYSDMALLGEQFDLDVAILPIGDNYTMGPQDAAKAAKMLKAKHVIPVHYDTWPVIAQDPEVFKDMVEAQCDRQVHIMKPGDALDIDKL